MELAHLSGFAVFAGSVVVALGTLGSAWLTKKHEARARRASENKVGLQKLYARFIEEASKLYMDALVRDEADASAMVSIYALISRMRMASNANVVENADAVIRTILTTYSRPNKTFPGLQNILLNRKFVDPLLTSWAAATQSSSGFAVISCQKVRNFATRSAGSFPAMMAELMAPMETPATQSGSMLASARASYTPAWSPRAHRRLARQARRIRTGGLVWRQSDAVGRERSWHVYLCVDGLRICC